jgi:hypothetical protein
VDAEVKSYDDLVVGLPQGNLTILGLARKLATEISYQPAPASGRRQWAIAERNRLNTLVQYKPVAVEHAWALTNTKNKGVETWI